jgi:hypothetical protein
VISLYVVNSGLEDYNSFKEEQKSFSIYEANKTKKYLTYDQYGGYGFRVIFEPSAQFALFQNHGIFDRIESNIDVREVVNLHDVKKGRSLFKTSKNKDFSGIIYVFFSLFFLLLGSTTVRSKKYLRAMLTLRDMIHLFVYRLVFLALTVTFIFLLNLLYLYLNGIAFPADSFSLVLSYFWYALLFLTFFYTLGFFISSITQKHKIHVALIVWFVLIFVVPELINTALWKEAQDIPPTEKLNYTKFETLLNAESKFYPNDNGGVNFNKDPKKDWRALAIKLWDEVYSANKESERQFQNSVEKVISKNYSYSLLFPTKFYEVMADEVSGKGFKGYLEFLKYTNQLRDKFMNFYIQKRYISNDSTVESFVKGEENIFQAKSRLPGNYYAGLGLAALYSLILLIASYFILRARLYKAPEDLRREELIFEKGASFFMMFKDPAYRDTVFENYIRQKNVSGIERVDILDIDLEINARSAIRYIASIRGINEQEILESLDILGIKERDLATKPNTHELLRKIYIAVQVAESDIIVINEFLRDLPRSFEIDFLRLVKESKAKGKMFVYLSVELINFGIEACESLETEFENYSFVKLPLENASYR